MQFPDISASGFDLSSVTTVSTAYESPLMAALKSEARKLPPFRGCAIRYLRCMAFINESLIFGFIIYYSIKRIYLNV